MMSMVADLLRPLRRIGDVRGRSTRGELVRWLVLAMIVAVAADLVAATSSAKDIARLTLSVLLLVPTVPLAVRRVHDVGWSGWWLVAAAPAVLYNIFVQAARVADPAFDPAGGSPVPVEAVPPMIGLLIGSFILMCWTAQDGPNRYGPDPRGAG